MKIKTKIITLALLLSMFVLFPTYAEKESITYQRYPYAIGATLSDPIWGLSYHQRFGESALQGVVGLSYNPDSLYSSLLTYSVAIDYQRTIFGADFNNYLGAQIYALGSLGHTGDIPYNYSSSSADPFEAKIILGAGFGVEFLFFQYFSMPVEFVYSFAYETTNNSFPSNISIDFIPKIGLRYRFN